MRRLRISLSSNRDLEGSIWLEGDGATLAGPYPVSARAADSIAAEHQNPTRSPLLPYGDPPTGTYRIAGVRETGTSSGLRTDLYGRFGAIVLLPWSGDAALADALGRFEILIHAGSLGANGALRMSAGDFRVSEETLSALKSEVLRPGGATWVVCNEVGVTKPEWNDEVDKPQQNPTWNHGPVHAGAMNASLIMVGEYSPDGEGAIEGKWPPE